jgi:hypothetical protein
MVTAIQEANAWRGFLLTLFSEDELERSRPGEWTPFPRGARGDSTVTRAQFDIAFTAIKKLKMTGADETPIEAFAASEELKDELFFLTQLVWGTELTPARLNLIVQFMLYKGGGKNPEDRKSYRPLSMINHARKLMAMILLMNLQEETGAFIPESYNGFRAGRSTDDTLTALLLGMTYLKEMGYEVMLLFLDLEGAFDKCSWRGIDTAIAAAGASAKSRAMFRTLYRTAQGIARVRKPDGETVDSNPYDIRKQCEVRPLCYDFSNVETFLNSESTKKALNVDESHSHNWAACNFGINMKFHVDWMKDFSPYVKDLLEAGFPALIYAGDVDFICNYLGNEAWTKDLEWSHKADFNAAGSHDWNSGAGVARTSHGLTFLQVVDGGHMVPSDQPENALEMLKTFLAGTDF